MTFVSSSATFAGGIHFRSGKPGGSIMSFSARPCSGGDGIRHQCHRFETSGGSRDTERRKIFVCHFSSASVTVRPGGRGTSFRTATIIIRSRDCGRKSLASIITAPGW
jgi:hypothetical protein